MQMADWRTSRLAMRTTGPAFFAIFLVSVGGHPCLAQGLPTTDEFDSRIKSCATAQKVRLAPDLVTAIATIYSAEPSKFRSATEFLTLLPNELALAALRFYQQCIGPVLSAADRASAQSQEQPVSSQTPSASSQGLTVTCQSERDSPWNKRTAEIVLPLSCPPEVEKGYDFTISGSYACGAIVSQDIVYNDKKRPIAVNLSISEKCWRWDNDATEAQKYCIRSDVPNYKASHTCVTVCFYSRR